MRSQLVLCLCSGIAGSVLTALLISGPPPVAPMFAAEPAEMQLAQGPRLTPVPGPESAAPDDLRFRPQRIPADSSAAERAAAERTAERATPERSTAERLTDDRPPLPIARGTLPTEEYTAEERVNISVYESCNRSVVHISTKVVNQNLLMFESLDEGEGSGSVLDKQGHILTNYHVVEGAREIEVTLFDGKSYDARLVGRDPSSDIAVLRIGAPPESLFPTRFGDSSRLKVGQRVFAIGNPFGLDRTLSTGVISSLNRSLPARNSRTIKSVIQIDAAINPGSSGGPLLDSRGRLIGMNTAIASRTGQNTGVGFAIPVSIASRVVPQLIQRGHVIRPDTGITRVYQSDRGLLIATMTPGGPAEAAGLKGIRIIRQRKRNGPFVYDTESLDRSGADLIVAVDGEHINSADEFLDIVESKRPGEEVTLTVVRQNREVDVRLRLGAGES